MEKYKNPELSVNERLTDLLNRMTLEEKVAQLTQFFGRYSYELKNGEVYLKDEFKTHLHGYGIGLLYGVQRADFLTGTTEENKLTPENAAALVNLIQKENMENTRLGIPLLFAEECSHGLMAYDAVTYPVPLMMGCTFNEELYGKVCREIAKEARTKGVMITYSPVLEVVRDIRWGRTEECFGEDVYMNTRFGIKGMKSYEGENIASGDSIIAAVKHFAVHGCPESGINVNTTSVGERQLHNTWLYPFKKAVEAGAKSVITSYNEIDGIPVTCNKKLIKNILKDTWGFKGFVFSDLGAVELIKDVYNLTDSYKEATKLAFEAGIDIDMLGVMYNKYLLELAKEKIIPVKEIDDSVSRILKIKFEMGLFENPYCKIGNVKNVKRNAETLSLARQAAREGIVLLKNKNNLLPLNKKINLKIAVIGPNANDVYNQLGDYTALQNRKNVITVYDGIKNVMPSTVYSLGCRIRDVNESHIPLAVKAAENSDIIIAVVGGSSDRFATKDSVDEKTGQARITDSSVSDMETGEGVDRMSLELLGVQLKLLKELKKLNKPLIVVYISGRPISDPWVDENADAILNASFPGEQGGSAVADVIFGDYNPSGRLTISIPKHTGQIPLYYNRHNSIKLAAGYVEMDAKPAYPFGYGLSYTNFRYDNITVDKKQIYRDEKITISFDLTNIGSVCGEEVCQLYINDVISSVVTPKMELRGFTKIFLNPGETKRVNFILSKNELEIFDINNEWTVEKGDFEVLVGSSSEDIRLKTEFKVI